MKKNDSTTLVELSKVESKKGATFKVISFGLTEAGVRVLTSKSDGLLGKVRPSTDKKAAAA
jgi:hypothetical protein